MCRVVELNIDGRLIRVADVKQKYMANIIDAAESCLAEAEKNSVKLAKYLRGGSAGIIYNKPVKK